MKPSPLIVELTGARGVGKSTLAHGIRTELLRRNIRFNVAKSRSLIKDLAIELTCARARLLLEKKWRSWGVDTPEALRVYRQRFRNYQVRRLRYQRETGIFLLDEGIFQLMMMIGIRSGQDIETISKFLSRLVPMPDLVISVEATTEVIEARRKMRSNAGDLLKPRVSSRSSEGLRKIQDYIRCLSNDSCTRAIVIDNSVPSNLTGTVPRLVDEIVNVHDVRHMQVDYRDMHLRVRGRSA